MAELQKQAEDPDLWQDPESAQRLMREISNLKEEVDEWQTLRVNIADTLELAQLRDESILSDLESETAIIEQDVAQREFEVAGSYRHQVINDSVEDAVESIVSILDEQGLSI